MRNRLEIPVAFLFLVMEFIASITLWPHAWIFACIFGVGSLAASLKAASTRGPAVRVAAIVCAVAAAMIMVVVLVDRFT